MLDPGFTPPAADSERSDARIEELLEVCAERGAVIAELETHIAALRRTADERGALIARLDEAIRLERDLHAESSAALSDRLRALEQRLDRQTIELHAWREAFGTIDAVHERIAALEAGVTERGALIEELHIACQERLSGMERLSAEAARRASLLADVTAVLESKSRELEQLRPRASRPS